MWLSIHEFDLKHIEMENLSHIKTLTKTSATQNSIRCIVRKSVFQTICQI